ncbi:cytochrome c oxidase assembly protein [Neobacillus drentensis]|uniref:cytochrome c oxidase assembly protein n=1 Tax=Neobacillus drentensis TaxID=220684 RepID=UPI002FFF8824
MFFDFLLQGQLLWSLPLLAMLFFIGGLYVILLLSFTKIKIRQKQPLFFFLSLVILYLTIGSPLSSLSHLSFSLHMLQLSILYFIIPPLFLLGIPDSLLQQFSKTAISKQVGIFVIPPKAALYAFGALFLMYHFPVILTVLSQNKLAHNGYLCVLLILSFWMWRPIAVPDLKKDGSVEKKRYVVLSGLVLMPACLLFVFNVIIGEMNNPFLIQMTANLCMSPSDLSSFNILPSPFNTSFDQILAGILMLIMHKFGLTLTVHLQKNVQQRSVEEIVE